MKVEQEQGDSNEKVVELKCKLCKSNAKNQMDLTTHKILVHGQCQYACKICDFVDPKIARIQKHSAQEHQNKVVYTYKCGFCPFKAKLSLMSKHLETSHEKEFEMKLDNKPLLNCTKCDFQHISNNKLERHMNKVHSLYECTKCEESFSIKRQLLVHRMHVHADFSYECDKCEFKTKHDSALYRHKQSFHTSNDPFTCPNCKRSLKRKDNYNQHLKTCKVGA